jgi:ketosteroid isomerase-like protein
VPTPTDVALPVSDLHTACADLIRRSALSNDAFMNGDMRRWREIDPLSPDFSIMTPYGGWTTGGFDATPDRLGAMARHFKRATTAFEVIATHASDDLVVIAAIERQRGVVGDLPEQDWSLRVTLVYRRGDDGWVLAHRHADPLVGRITGNQLSLIARGAVPDMPARA